MIYKKIKLFIKLKTGKRISLHAKLSAYTKGIIPDLKRFVEQAPNDDKMYVRKNGQWVVFDSFTIIDDITDTNELNEGSTYYTITEDADIIYNGGTAFSSENEEYDESIIPGNARTTNYDIECIPMNARGEFINEANDN